MTAPTLGAMHPHTTHGPQRIVAVWPHSVTLACGCTAWLRTDERQNTMSTTIIRPDDSRSDVEDACAHLEATCEGIYATFFRETDPDTGNPSWVIEVNGWGEEQVFGTVADVRAFEAQVVAVQEKALQP